MADLRLLGTAALGAALWLTLPTGNRFDVAVLIPGAPTALAEDLRPAVGLPLSKAKSLMAAHNYAAAQAQVAIAARQKNLTANESFVIQQMRGAIAQSAGDIPTAYRTFQDLINSGRVSGPQLTQLLLATTSLAYQSKDYPATISWAQKYIKAGGKDPAVQTLIIQSYYLQKDWTNAAKFQQAQIDAVLKAHKIPPEDQLQLLAACQKQIPDNAGLDTTMQMLITYYPKQSYWADVLYALQVKPGLADRLELDIDRLRVRTGTMSREQDYMQMAQLALGENDSGGAAVVMKQARDQKVFGSGPQQAREDRLGALVTKTAADTQGKLDANLAALRGAPTTTSQQLFDLGQNYASFGQFDKGVGLMQEAIAKGDLRRPALAHLRVAEALVASGNKTAALAAFKAVPQTTDGTSELAGLWMLWLKTQATLPAPAHS